jgi:hypothetical protein
MHDAIGHGLQRDLFEGAGQGVAVAAMGVVRAALFVLLNLAAWAYMGYYTLADLGARPVGGGALLLKSLGWGTAVYLATYAVFFVLIACVIPL